MTAKCSYPEDFEKLWLCFYETEKRGLGKRGSKAEAYNAWKNIDLDVDVMIDALREQARHKIKERRADRRWDPFKHVCRWLKYRCWEDAPVELDKALINKENAEGLQERVQERLTDLGDRDWAAGSGYDHLDRSWASEPLAEEDRLKLEQKLYG